MKKYLLILVIFQLLFSCQSEKEQSKGDLNNLQKGAQELKESQIDFFIGSTPKKFSAKTIDGKTFNSEDFSNKSLVIFIYNLSYFKSNEAYLKELNNIYNAYKDKIEFVGIIDGYAENQKELNQYLKNSNIQFEQIDNTLSQEKSEILNYNIFCTPAKILIDTNGKVIYSSCGDGNSYKLTQKLDSLKNYR